MAQALWSRFFKDVVLENVGRCVLVALWVWPCAHARHVLRR